MARVLLRSNTWAGDEAPESPPRNVAAPLSTPNPTHVNAANSISAGQVQELSVLQRFVPGGLIQRYCRSTYVWPYIHA